MNPPLMDPRFLRLYFDKGRFAAPRHGLPFRALAALGHLEAAVSRVARQIFFDGNPERKNVRAGFLEFELTLRTLDIGCADAMVVRADVDPEDGDEFYEARGKLLEEIQRLNDGQDDCDLSRLALHDLARTFAFLTGEETLSVFLPDKEEAALTINRGTIARVEIAASRQPVTEVRALHLVGKPYIINTTQMTLGLYRRETRDTVSLPITAADESTYLPAIAVNEARLLRAVGTATYEDHILQGITPNLTFSLVGGPKLTARIEEIGRLEDGWLDGDGKAPKWAFLQRAERAVWHIVEATGLDRPHVYPTPEGGLQAEWEVRGVAFQVTFAPNGRALRMHGVATWAGGAGSELEDTAEVADAVAWVETIGVLNA